EVVRIDGILDQCERGNLSGPFPGERPPRYHYGVGGAETRPAIEDVEATRFQPLQDPRAAKPGGPELVSQPPANTVAHASPRVEQVACPAAARLERRAPPWRPGSPIQIRERRAGGAPLRLRHIQPPARPVDGEILPEVGELKRRADRIGLNVEGFVRISRQAKHDAA